MAGRTTAVVASSGVVLVLGAGLLVPAPALAAPVYDPQPMPRRVTDVVAPGVVPVVESTRVRAVEVTAAGRLYFTTGPAESRGGTVRAWSLAHGAATPVALGVTGTAVAHGSPGIAMRVVGERVVLMASGATVSEPRGVWVSDGTAAGTRRVGPLGEAPALPLQRAGEAFVPGSVGGGVQTLESIDPVAGTRTVVASSTNSTFRPLGSTPAGMVHVADSAVWVQPSEGAPVRLVSGTVGQEFAVQALGFGPGELWFMAQGRLYRTDGTPAGTRRELGRETFPDGFAHGFRTTAGVAQFWWQHHDGTRLQVESVSSATGRRVVLDQPAGTPWQVESRRVGERLVAKVGLTNQSSFGEEIAVLTTTGATEVVLTHMEPITDWTVSGEGASARVLVAAGTELVRIDVADGTRRRLLGGTRVGWVADARGTTYFSRSNALHGLELWRTKGTVASTRLVKDLRPGPKGSSPLPLAASASGQFWFSADDGRSGHELWTLGPGVLPRTDATVVTRWPRPASRQRLPRSVHVKVPLAPGEDVTARISGTLTVPGRPRVKLRTRTVQLAAGAAPTLRVEVPRSRRERVRAGVRRYRQAPAPARTKRKVVARVTVRLTDRSGDRVVRTFRVRLV